MAAEGNGWDVDKRNVRHQLETLHEDNRRLYELVGDIREEVAALRVKSSLWGVLGGVVVSIPTTVGLVIGILKVLQ